MNKLLPTLDFLHSLPRLLRPTRRLSLRRNLAQPLFPECPPLQAIHARAGKQRPRLKHSVLRGIGRLRPLEHDPARILDPDAHGVEPVLELGPGLFVLQGVSHNPEPEVVPCHRLDVEKSRGESIQVEPFLGFLRPGVGFLGVILGSWGMS